MTSIIDRAASRVVEAAERYNPIAVVGLLSGGHDSLTANIVAHKAGADFSLHINTGIGVPQTRNFVFDTCERERWDLREYKAMDHVNAAGESDPQDYEEIVRAHGFPGPFMHAKMYVRLKERQLRQFEREIGATAARPVLYVSGVRSDESVRRMLNVSPETKKEGRRVWVSPIHDFTKLDCGACIKACGVQRSPVVDLIHKSGECLCGAFASPGELAELKVWFPDVARRIESLESEVMKRWPWKWEDQGPPDWFIEKKRGQQFMAFHDQEIESQPLCHRCNATAATR